MSSNRELKRLKRLEKIKARKAALGGQNASTAPETAKASNLEVMHPAAQVLDPVVSLEAPKSSDDGLGLTEVIVIEPPASEPETITVADRLPDAPEARMARVYAKPLNPRLRLIEFEDGTHGRVQVKMDSQPMIGWKVWVKPHEDIAGDWQLHGTYNWRGLRKV